MRKLLLLAFTVAFAVASHAQETTPADKEAAYTKTITDRAKKIAITLSLQDSVKENRVTTIIANQYRNLNKVYTDRDNRIQVIKNDAVEKKITDSLVKTIEEVATREAQALHQPFIKSLSRELTADQVTKVKDGMTYNVLSVTYKAMNEMIPTLKQTEKDQIMAWLVEAREFAMDAESSDKKHWWFGKYKGKINNYLSTQGYDLQKERKGWEERIKAAKDKEKSTQNQ
jgi:hypothetical protein